VVALRDAERETSNRGVAPKALDSSWQETSSSGKRVFPAADQDLLVAAWEPLDAELLPEAALQVRTVGTRRG